MKEKWYWYFILAIVFMAIGIFFVYRTSHQVISPQMGEFGGVSLRLEFATTTAARELGLGGRENIPDDLGMLFIFPADGEYGFWMKDMHVPIDIFWLDDAGRVVSFISNVATSTYPTVFYPVVPVRYVLETAAGFARARDIATGTPLLLQNWPSVTQ